MKQYRLAAWPELPAAYQGMAYCRMLHQMSHRPASLRQLVRSSGLQRSAVRHFLDTLSQRDLLIEGAPLPTPNLVGWLRQRLRPAGAAASASSATAASRA